MSNVSLPQVRVFIATSIDGFIAGKNGELGWLASVEDPDEDYGTAAFMQQADAVVMGRATHEAVLGMATWPFTGKSVTVLTHRPLEQVHGVQVHEGSLRPLLEQLGRQGRKTVYLDGGAAIRQGLREDLVDEMTVSIIPILLGEGLPLFGPGTPERRWHTVDARAYPSGLVQLHWKRRADDSGMQGAVPQNIAE
jgi:dihydrofolate reductase